MSDDKLGLQISFGTGDMSDEEFDAEVKKKDHLRPDQTFIVDAARDSDRAFSIDGQENPKLVFINGNRIRIALTVKNGEHDFVIDELGVKTEALPEGEVKVIDFDVDKVGTFEYYCSVGDNRAEGMSGTVEVIEVDEQDSTDGYYGMMRQT